MTLRYNSAMDTICKHDTGAAVEDVQQRLALLGILANDHVSGTFDDVTAKAVRTFCERNALDPLEEVNEKVWAVLVDATFYLGDRTLYLRMPYFHGNDVLQLQKA
ncbi:MAG: peptidoglycan-binding domain-containing protein, partial [Raoultibacter sp.]